MSPDSPITTVFLVITPVLSLLAIFLCLISKHGRNLAYTEEVTKGIKSETPFPSPISNSSSKHSNYRQMSNSRSNSTFESPNESLYIPSDLLINDIPDNAYIVRKEYIPKSVDELPIRKNQILTVKEIYEDGWCMTISPNSGEMGVVPLKCLYKYSDFLKKKQKQKLQYAQQFQKNEPQIPKIVIK